MNGLNGLMIQGLGKQMQQMQFRKVAGKMTAAHSMAGPQPFANASFMGLMEENIHMKPWCSILR